MELEKIINGKEASKETTDSKQTNKTLWEMQLKTQQENLVQIKNSEKTAETEKEEIETIKKIDLLKKELENIYKEEKVENILSNNPDKLVDIKLATLQLKSKKEEIEKVDKEIAELEIHMEFFKDSLKKDIPLREMEIQRKLERIASLKTDKSELEQEQKEIERKLEKIERELTK